MTGSLGFCRQRNWNEHFEGGLSLRRLQAPKLIEKLSWLAAFIDWLPPWHVRSQP
eukprot:COSAG04_NODE_19224_length_421_cov_0.965839_1_plen_54_part_10